MKRNSPIYVAGHTGLIGSAMCRLLAREGFENIITSSHSDLDLADSTTVDEFFKLNSPQYVVLAAGRVGGILENITYPADLIIENLSIQLNVLRASLRQGVRKVIYFGSSCMYPREAPQPMAEDMLLSGALEPTSLAYAISKISGMQMCLAFNQQIKERRFIPLIPNSVYGCGDDFDVNSAHVVPALIRRIHDAHVKGAKSITLWGSGRPKREFIYSDDVARACLVLLKGDTSTMELPVNIGVGYDYSIQELAEKIASIVEYKGQIEWDLTKPDGAPRKLLDISRIQSFGWKAEIELVTGLKMTYESFLRSLSQASV